MGDFKRIRVHKGIRQKTKNKEKYSHKGAKTPRK
jgi:hypothetical protein